jgi:hypothetical protein
MHAEWRVHLLFIAQACKALTAASLALRAILLDLRLGMLWSAVLKREQPEALQKVGVAALWFAGGAPGSQGMAVSLHVRGAHAGHIEHAGGQRLACIGPMRPPHWG